MKETILNNLDREIESLRDEVKKLESKITCIYLHNKVLCNACRELITMENSDIDESELRAEIKALWNAINF